MVTESLGTETKEEKESKNLLHTQFRELPIKASNN